MHLKHSSWPTPHPSLICVELLRGSRQPITDRLAQHTLATQRLREDDEPVTSGGRATQGHPIELTVKPPPQCYWRAAATAAGARSHFAAGNSDNLVRARQIKRNGRQARRLADA